MPPTPPAYTAKPVKAPTTTPSPSHQDAYKPPKPTHSTPEPPFKVSKPQKKLRKMHPKVLGPISAHLILSTHEANIAASPLLRLPSELRNIIYTYALSSPTGYLRYSKAARRFDVSGIGAGLLTSCHLVAFETLYLPLQLNELVFERPRRLEPSVVDVIVKLVKLRQKVGWHERLRIGFERPGE